MHWTGPGEDEMDMKGDVTSGEVLVKGCSVSGLLPTGTVLRRVDSRTSHRLSNPWYIYRCLLQLLHCSSHQHQLSTA